MNSKQFIAITTGTAIVSGIVGKLIGNKTCKEKNELLQRNIY